MMRRRALLRRAVMVAGIALLPGCQRRSSEPPSRLVSCVSTHDGHFQVVCGDAETALNLSERGHECVVSKDKSRILVCMRRPGRRLVLLDAQGNRLLQRTLPRDTYLEGHAVWHASGWLTVETHSVSREAIIVLRDHESLQVMEQWKPGGLGYHQLGLLADQQTLVIAQGGLKMASEDGRRPINVDSMQPALTYFDLQQAKVMDEYRPLHHQQSVRHLAIDERDRVIMGVQSQHVYPNDLPLIYTHAGETQLQPMQSDRTLWPTLKQYTASVSIGNQVACVTAPRGGCVTFWDVVSHRLLHVARFKDCAGVAFDQEASVFSVSNGAGYIKRYAVSRQLQQDDVFLPSVRLEAVEHWASIRWDNHLALM